ncbi:pyridoxal phosphate-dependent aminotransferase family protein [Porticoccaceae bacterium]|nr:pyridoxal phosphate-dependent aminotransferase family protein [Porticoccaceae bacterium]
MTPFPIMNSAPGPKTFINGREVDYFCGAGYLDLQGDRELIEALCDAAKFYGTGSATSRSGYGNNPVLLEVEQKAAQYFGTESALYYASGYLGNAILLQGLAADYDMIFSDDQAHYSIKDGAAMSQKPVVLFRHTDPEDLARKLKTHLKPSQVPLVISDGIFPASGVIAPLDEYDSVLTAYDNNILCVDDAHALGVIGEKGRGSLEYCQVEGERRYCSGTLSKAFGSYGGIIPGSHKLIEQLTKHSHIPRGSSSVPTPLAAASAKALSLLSVQPERRGQLWENVAQAKFAFRSLGFDSIPNTPVPIICLSSDRFDLEAIHRRLLTKGIVTHYVPGSSYTSVPDNGALRVAITSSHSEAQINLLVKVVRSYLHGLV